MVAKAAIHAIMLTMSSEGRKSNLPSAAALAITLSKPPAMLLAMSPAIQLTQIRPMTITIICTKVVIATDHMPPNRV